MPLPIEIVGLQQPQLRIIWDEDHESVWSVRDLRLRCRCAHCVDEMTDKPILDPAKVPAVMTVLGMELVGTYGLRIDFSDQHGTGIFRFNDLLKDCPCAACRAK